MEIVAFEDLTPEQQKTYKEVAKKELFNEFEVIEKKKLVKKITLEVPPNTPPGLVENSREMKRHLVEDLGLKYSFAGSIDKIEKWTRQRRKNEDKPWTLNIDGVEVLLSLVPFFLLGNSGNEGINKKLDEMIKIEENI